MRPPAAPCCAPRRYLAALTRLLPTLTRIQLTDYMGCVDPSILLPPAPPGSKPGAQTAAPPAHAAAAAGKEVAGGGGGSRAGTPALLLQQGQGGATASSLAGWQRAVAELPVPGGISQFDVTYQR